jgi:hypothetical protein
MDAETNEERILMEDSFLKALDKQKDADGLRNKTRPAEWLQGAAMGFQWGWDARKENLK